MAIMIFQSPQSFGFFFADRISLRGPLNACGLAAAMLCGMLCGPAAGQENHDFFHAESRAIAAAVSRVSGGVVLIEVFGVSQTTAGEVAVDAPTVGTVVDEAGYILASSVVNDRPAASILVVLEDGTRLPATVIAEDEGRELVMLKVSPPRPLPAVRWVAPSQVRVGEYAIAVGRLRAAGPPARSVGIVSALSRLQGRALQTDARISPPFYGGPLLNLRGEVLGIIVPAMPDAGGGGDPSGWYDSGIAFVAPADQIATRLDQLKNGTSIRPGRLGIVSASSDPLATGTKIAAVRIGSPAADAGLRAGDIVRAVNQIPVTRHAEIRELLGPLDAGMTVKIEVERDGNRIEVQPTLVAEIPPFEPQAIGLLLAPDGDGAVVAAVYANSPAERASVLQGDRVIGLDETEIRTAQDLRNRVLTLRPAREVELRLLRNEAPVNVRLTPEAVAKAWPVSLPPPSDPLDAKDWSIRPFTLPDVPNKCVVLGPPDSTPSAVALLVVFARPGAEELADFLERLKTTAGEQHVVVAVIGSQDPQGWTPDEAELAGRLTALLKQRFQVQPHAVAFTGDGAGETLAMLAAFTEGSPAAGLAVSAGVRLPAIRARENDPAKPVHLFLRGMSGSEKAPPWTEVLGKAGYAVVRGGEEDVELMQFVWSLGRI